MIYEVYWVRQVQVTQEQQWAVELNVSDTDMTLAGEIKLDLMINVKFYPFNS